ncbi:MAG: hypothetical protein ACJZ12_04695 [Candidatus Neomarinimicrobiota bacterium]
MYFNKKFSHAISKVPKKGDFRVQEEHGGRISLIEKLPNKIKSLADKVLAILPEGCFYSRIDMLLLHGKPKIIEVELIEPSLYFNLDLKSSEIFARELQRHFSGLT